MPEKADRFDQGKVQLGYLVHFQQSLMALCRVCEYGASKYTPHNWKKGGKPDEEYLNAAFRHIFAWARKEIFDPESGCNHLAHAIWNLMVIIDVNHPADVADFPIFLEAIKKNLATIPQVKITEPATS